MGVDCVTKHIDEYDALLAKMASTLVKIKQENQQGQYQRRTQVTDLFGMEHSAYGDSTHPATVYLSVSPDLMYFERFEFKVIIRPFAMPVAGQGTTDNATAVIKDTTLSLSGSNISPNPHSHKSDPHYHNLTAGVSLFPSKVSNFEIFIEGINMTNAFKKQHPNWINGEGVFPDAADTFNNFDVLKAVSELHDWQQGVILQPGYKKVELKGDGIFNATLVTYIKYSHPNR